MKPLSERIRISVEASAEIQAEHELNQAFEAMAEELKPSKIQAARQLWYEFMEDESHRNSVAFLRHLVILLGLSVAFFVFIYWIAGGFR